MSRHSNTSHLLCYWIACIVGLHCQAQTAPPTIPLASLDHYEAVIQHQKLESMIIKRLHLVGPQTIEIEVPHGYRLDTNAKDASAEFVNQRAVGYSYNLYSFPQKAFHYELTAQTLNSYMENLALAHKPEAEFEIIELAELTGGRAKFRILGRKALTIRYALNVEEQHIVVAENWVQYGDMIYVISVVGPERLFETIFKQIRIELNSMHLVE